MKEVRDILEDLQNNQLQIYALWSEDGDVHRSFIQQPLRPGSLNTLHLAHNGRMVGQQNFSHTYGLPAMMTNSALHLSPNGMYNNRKNKAHRQSINNANSVDIEGRASGD